MAARWPFQILAHAHQWLSITDPVGGRCWQQGRGYRRAMEASPGIAESYWMDSTRQTSYPEVTDDVEVDVP